MRTEKNGSKIITQYATIPRPYARMRFFFFPLFEKKRKKHFYKTRKEKKLTWLI